MSSQGGTPAYVSPEQAAGKTLSRQTDIWSWGVSVFDLFTGQIPACRSGTVASYVLDDYLATGPVSAQLPRMPQPLVDVLRQCFQLALADRWVTLGIVPEILVSLYREVAGSQYPRSLTKAEGLEAAPPHDRRTIDGPTWLDPREVYRKGLQILGVDAVEVVDQLFPPRELSRRAQVSADLAMHDSLWRYGTRVIAEGRSELIPGAAELAMSKALVHLASDDLHGALAS